jgi:hypothetical protein
MGEAMKSNVSKKYDHKQAIDRLIDVYREVLS